MLQLLFIKKVSSMASKPIKIRWIRTSSQDFWKILYRIIDNFLRIINQKIITLILALFTRAFGPMGLTKLELILYLLFYYPRKVDELNDH